MRDLILVGASGFGRETAEAVRALNAVSPTWRLLGFVDDDRRLHRRLVGGVRVIGPVEGLLDQPEARVAICTGRPDNYASRPLIAQRLDLAGDRYATILHPTVTVGDSCEVGPGSVLLAHVDLTAGVTVGRHVAVMPQVVLTHDVDVGDYVTIASGVRVSGGCRIAEGAYIGSGTCLREGLTIGERAMVGMGSILTRSVPAGRLWYGAPARDMGPAPRP
jgi:sugar O-acyltransferase (sialic acid O-acetyltransferase NeuD family)